MPYRLTKIKLWSPEDDTHLLTRIELYGLKNWCLISNDLKNIGLIRTPKQCRDRCCNILKLTNQSHSFTQTEAQKVFDIYFEVGSQWALISNRLGSKTENQVKNFLNSTVRRNVRKFNKGKSYSDRISISSLELLSIPELKELLLAGKHVNSEEFFGRKLSERTKKTIQEIFFRKLEDKVGSKKGNWRQENELVNELDLILDEQARVEGWKRGESESLLAQDEVEIGFLEGNWVNF